MEKALDYNEVMKFMREFGIDYINLYGELIIDEPTNTYVGIDKCTTMEQVKTYVVFTLCRPIGKGLPNLAATRLLGRVNKYFNINLTKKDMLTMYQQLCYVSKLDEFTSFINRGFPMNELKKDLD